MVVIRQLQSINLSALHVSEVMQRRYSGDLAIQGRTDMYNVREYGAPAPQYGEQWQPQQEYYPAQYPNVAYDRKPRPVLQEDLLGPPSWPPLDNRGDFGTGLVWEETMPVSPVRSQVSHHEVLWSDEDGNVQSRATSQRTVHSALPEYGPPPQGRLSRITVRWFCCFLVQASVQTGRGRRPLPRLRVQA